MNAEHWAILGFTFFAALLLVMFSLGTRSESGLYRWTRRIFWAAALLLLSGALGGVGLNPFNWLTSAVLGLPGYAALWTLAAL